MNVGLLNLTINLTVKMERSYMILRKKPVLYFIVSLLCFIVPSMSVIGEEKEDIPQFIENDIIHNPTGIKISEDELINVIKDFRTIFIGETHDNYRAHQVQLKIIKGLFSVSKGNIAIGMEMFQKRSQEKLDAFISGETTEKQFLQEVWFPDWGFDYDYYKEIINFAKEKKIPLLALNANNELREQINAKGFEDLSDEEKRDLPEIDMSDEYHRKSIKSIYDVHAGSTLDDFEKFYRIQCLWDETMAQSAANFRQSEEGRGKQLIILAGKGHVRYGFGIPKRLFRRLKESYCTILPVEIRIPENKKHNIMNVEDVQIPLEVSDFSWMVDYSDTDSVKVRLGVIVMKSEKGVFVQNVAENSSAEILGMKKDDVIIKVDGTLIKEPFDLIYEIGKKVPGQKGNIEILRDGKKINFDITYQAASPEEITDPK